jgi:Cu2+-exporting ATPase
LIARPAFAGTVSSRACAHCGQVLLRTAFPGPEGAFFCCEGCREVHAFLAGERWAPYRDLMVQGGKRAPRAWVGEAFRSLLASLEDPATLAGLGRWNGRRHAVTLRARDVTCAGCGFLVEALLRESPGVDAFEVDFLHGEAYLEYDAEKTTLGEVLERLARFGYRLEPIDGTGSAKPEPDRGLLYRIAVAAFCFMNSMAFSAAVYAGIGRGISASWARVFGLAGFAVALPAVLYCAQPFYQGAWRAWRAKRFNVDSTVTLGVAVAFLASAHAAWTGRGGNFSDSLSGLVFFLLAGRWAVRRFEAGLALEGRWFERLAPGHVTVRRGEGLARVPAESVREGEIVELGAGEYAPVDGSLAADEAWMDTSLLTGESRAARLRRDDPVFAGYLNLKGRAALRASGPRGQTRIAGLRRDLAALSAGRGPVPDGSGRVAMRFTLAVAACAVAAFFLHLRSGLPHALETAASVFIVSCACALALAVPINRGLGLKRARALGFHFRAQAALEALRGVRCVLFDKTGTLTFTRRSVAGWDWRGGWRGDASLQDSALRSLRAATAGSLHPVSLSIQAALEILPPDGLRAGHARELPHFGIVARVPDPAGREQVICLCKSGAWSAAGPFAEMGYAIPEGPLPSADSCLFVDGELAALIRFTEEIKPEAARLIAALEARGLGVALLSGDNPDKVRDFAGACGIREWRASLSPEAKRAAAEEYRRRYGRLLAVGDGFNDSLLFGSSDLAMAVAGGAADRLEGVDVLASGDRPMALASLFALADGVSRGVRLGYWASGVYNAGAIAAALAGWVTPLFAAVLMPISGLSLCLLAWLSIPRQP